MSPGFLDRYVINDIYMWPGEYVCIDKIGSRHIATGYLCVCGWERDEEYVILLLVWWQYICAIKRDLTVVQRSTKLYIIRAWIGNSLMESIYIYIISCACTAIIGSTGVWMGGPHQNSIPRLERVPVRGCIIEFQLSTLLTFYVNWVIWVWVSFIFSNFDFAGSILSER